MDAKRGEYKPLRNMAQRFPLAQSLADLWFIQRKIYRGIDLPGGFEQLPVPRGSHFTHAYPPFKLDLIARELLIHASSQGHGDRSLRRHNHLANLMNTIRSYGDVTTGTGGTNALFSVLHRIGHQQLPAQQNLHREMVRAQLVYGHQALDAVMRRQTGLSMSENVRLSLLVVREAMAAPVWRRRDHYRDIGIADDIADAYFRRLSLSVEEHRAAQIKEQVLDIGWEFTLNSLHACPLITADATRMRFCCPLVPHFIRRVFSGLYFDLVDAPGFSDAYGLAVDRHMAKALSTGFPTAALVKPEPYFIRREMFEGSDWICSDHSAHIFLECKGKRPRMQMRILLDEADMEDDIDTLARAIAQNYRNIADALAGLTTWQPDERPIFSIVATLEDWVLFSPAAQEPLHRRVLHHMRRKGLDHEMATRVPYLVASASDLEELSFAMSQSGIETVLRSKVTGEHKGWMLAPFLRSQYPIAHLSAETMFDIEAERLLAEAAQLAR